MNKEIFEKGDTVIVIKNNKAHTAKLARKDGIFWKLNLTHPDDCCNFWTEDQLKLVKKKENDK